jgi:hypothetical protein
MLETNHVTLRTLTAEFPLQIPADIAELARKWAELLDNSGAWNRSEKSYKELEAKSREDLKALGLDATDALLRKIANSGIVEIRFGSSAGDAWRVPWEFLLSAATERFRSRSQQLIVVRLLHPHNLRKSAQPDDAPKSITVIKNNPDFIANVYSDRSLSYEEENVKAGLQLQETPEAHNLTISELSHLIREHSPDVIHLAGIDSSQSFAIQYEDAGDRLRRKPPAGAMMFSAADGTAEAVPYGQLASCLCTGAGGTPKLVAFNFNKSAVAAGECVNAGAQYAVGFYTAVDDLAAEVFFTNFYLAWRLSAWDPLDAFKLSLQQLPEEFPKTVLRGMIITLWSRVSLLDREKNRRKEQKITSSASDPSLQLTRAFSKELEKALTAERPIDSLRVLIHGPPELNYCLLHNNRDIFDGFYIRKLAVNAVVPDVSVEVSLHVGEQELLYRVRRNMRYAIWMLSDLVRVPLSAAVVKRVRESTYTNLRVRVCEGVQPIYENTFRVNLLPADHWQDDERNSKWLPSFVLPRDPSVAELVDAAQKYLSAVSDDPHLGFDGYETSPLTAAMQVQAMWYALLNDYSLSYVNPPPVFTNHAQRLRSPSDTLKGNRGTCMDLSLLLAAAMEYVELYPVIFLFNNHAFPGFFTDKQVHENLREQVLRKASDEADTWMLGDDFKKTILELVKSKTLIPIETISLTKKSSLSEAIATGVKRVTSAGSRLKHVVDIRLARESKVTPLPL